MRKLPIGIQSFEKLRTNDYVYIDKTEIAYRLAKDNGYYFLSRPRRFGKSLFVDTLKCLFEGRKELFNGLYIYDRWDWNTKYPVIHIDFTLNKSDKKEELKSFIENKLKAIAEKNGIILSTNVYNQIFEELIVKLSGKNKIVLLIDEYDKPILDNIEKPEIATEMREILKGFYQVIKGCDEYVRFVFLTGVSKFSKVSLFSGLNNLMDITVHRDYATICGYTQSDVEREFYEYMEGVDKERMKLWYNGYGWLGERVYNPFDVLLFFSNHKEYRNYWFETGSPAFLLKLFQKNRYFIPDIDRIRADDSLLSSFDVDNINPATLLFQTGYLTIDRYDDGVYYLRLPNLEVRSALYDSILKHYSGDAEKATGVKIDLKDDVRNGDIEGMIERFKRLFSSIPYNWYVNNELDRYEGYYVSIFYSVFHSLGLEVIGEDITNKGRIDITVKSKDKVFIFEFKVVKEKSETDPLEQIKKRKYYEKYQKSIEEKPEIYLIGIEFSEGERNIVNYRWERVDF